LAQQKSAPGWNIIWLVCCFWIVMGLVTSFQTYYFLSSVKQGPPATQAFYLASSFSIIWAIFTPLIFWLARRFPLERATIKKHLPLHLFFSVVVGLLVRLIFLLAQFRPLSTQRVMSDLVTTFDYQAMVYWVMLAIHEGFLYYGKYQEGKLRAAQLETQLFQAQLAGLRMQLQPHFLFNTLNVINSLVFESKDRASEMIVRLSEFLRLSLETNVEQEVTLARELDFIERYLEIERVRFDERLEVTYQIDPATYDLLVPNLLLQPLVENAIKHGISRLARGGKLVIGAIGGNETLSVFVANSGPGLSSDPLKAERKGIGLSNTVSRLTALYGLAHRFELKNWHEGGVEAWVTFPVRPASVQQEDGCVHEGTHR
jgi:sensor histidine kinase YesM